MHGWLTLILFLRAPPPQPPSLSAAEALSTFPPVGLSQGGIIRLHGYVAFSDWPPLLNNMDRLSLW